MKRTTPWFTIGIVAAIVGLLTVFMALLYNWQLAASVAEREQLQRRAEADTKAFADDFNREIQGAFFNFQVDPSKIAVGDGSELDERHAFWQSNTAYPMLIEEFVAFTSEGGTFRYSIGKILIPVPLDEATNKLREQIENGQRSGPIFNNGYTLAIPLHQKNDKVERIMIRRTPDEIAQRPIDLPKPAGFVVVVLNELIIKKKILPELVAKHFPTGDFNVVVTDQSGANVFQTAELGETRDAKAGLFDLTPDHLIWVANREALPRRAPAGGEVVLNQRIESRTITPGDKPKVETGETFTIQMKESGANKRTAVFSGDPRADSPWQLSVEHTAGSIDAFISGERNRNLAIGIGVYLLLLGSILAIVFSSLRAKAYAQRQIDFVSSVSHEFRTPLAVIYSAGENLADGVARDGEQVSRYGDLIKGEGKKLSAMVEQILEFAGAKSGRKKYCFVSTDVSEITAKALEECMPELESKGFAVESTIAVDLPSIKVDPEAISIAIHNLIQNAVKYSNGTRWLKVSTENGGSAIKIIVEDGGIGISPEDRKKIFEPFYRAKDAVDAQIHGNGLGLSLVKEIAEAHGGKVGVTSEVGNGSKFVIEVPLV